MSEKEKKTANPETKSTVIKSVTAFVCAVMISITGSSITDKVCDTNIELSKSKTSVSSENYVESDDTSADVLPDNDIIIQENNDTAEPEITISDNNTAANNTFGGQTAASSEKTQSDSKPTKKSNKKSVEEIVSMYNTAANKIKPSAKIIARNYCKKDNLSEYLELPSAISSIGEWAINQFVKGSDEPAIFDEKEEIDEYFPISYESYTSKLTADMVKSATCVEDGNTYKITIILKDDSITSPKKGTGYAGVFNTVNASTFEGINIPGTTFESVKCNGINGKIQCTIDKSTQRITYLNLKNTDILDLQVKVGGKQFKVKMAFANENDYTVKY